MLNGQVENSQLRELLNSNASQVSDLRSQISKLNEEITELRSNVVQKTSENVGQISQNSELKTSLDQIDVQVKIAEAIEHIRLTVQALQNPPYDSLNVP
jgi:regulator of replication initiation timing